MNEETNEVREDMKKLAGGHFCREVQASFAEHLKAYFSALLDVNLGEDKVIIWAGV